MLLLFFFGARCSPFYFRLYLCYDMLDCDLHCDDSSCKLLWGYTVVVLNVLVISGFVATEPVLMSCHRAKRRGSAVIVLLFPTKIVATVSPKSLLVYKVQKATDVYFNYDPVGKRLSGLDSAHPSHATALLKSLLSLQREGLFLLPPSLPNVCGVKTAGRKKKYRLIRIAAQLAE